MFTVTVTEKDGQTATLSFDKNEVSIGRVKGNDIVLPKGNVSKRHSRIVVKDGKFIVVDLKSTNGTYVNGRKITSPQVIKDSDKVYIGDFTIAIADSAGMGAGPPAPPPPGMGDMSGASGSALPSANPGGMGGPSLSRLGGPPSPPPPEPPGNPGMSGLGLGGRPPLSGGAPPPPSPLSSNRPGMGERRATAQDMPSLSSPGRGGPNSSPTNALRPSSLSPRGSAPPPSPRPPLGGPSSSGMGAPGGLGGPNNDLGPPSSPGGHAQQSTPPPGRLGSSGAPASMANQNTPPRGLGAPSGRLGSGGAPARPSSGGQAPMPNVRPLAPPPPVAPALFTPGAVAIPSPPRLVSRFDESFYGQQTQAADQFFATVDPRDLPTLYPPSEEDRQRFEQIVRDITTRVGAGPDVAEHLLSEAIGLGPLEVLLDDENIEEIYVNSHDQLLYKQSGQIVVAQRTYSHPDFLFLTAQRLLGGRADEPGAEPVDEVRFSDGTRVHIVMPPLAPRGPVLTVRKAPRSYRSLSDLVNAGALSHGMADFLTKAVEAGRSIVVGGPTGSGRTEMLNALGELIPNGTRIVVIEDDGGLKLPQETLVSLEAGPGGDARFDLRYLMRSALRMRPDRILVNALSGPEVYDWVTAAAGGTYGSMAACHATSAHDLLGRLESLALLGAHDLSPRGLREQIARAVHLAVITHRGADGQMRVQQIAEVQGIDLDAFRVGDVFVYHPDGSGAGTHKPTGYVPVFYEALKNAGSSVDTGIFQT